MTQFITEIMEVSKEASTDNNNDKHECSETKVTIDQTYTKNVHWPAASN